MGSPLGGRGRRGSYGGITIAIPLARSVDQSLGVRHLGTKKCTKNDGQDVSRSLCFFSKWCSVFPWTPSAVTWHNMSNLCAAVDRCGIIGLCIQELESSFSRDRVFDVALQNVPRMQGLSMIISQQNGSTKWLVHLERGQLSRLLATNELGRPPSLRVLAGFLRNRGRACSVSD